MPVRLVFKPYGDAAYKLQGSEDAEKIFKVLWQRASHFAVVNSFVPVLNYPEPGAKRVKRVMRTCAAFPCRQLIEAGYWALEWPASLRERAADAALVLYGKAKEQCYKAMLSQSKGLFWEGEGGWDDLMLFHDSQLLFYVCSHDKEGEILAPRSLFISLDLLPTGCPSRREWVLRGDQVPPVFLRRLLALDAFRA